MSRVLGVDYGEKRIGLAISDPERTMAVAKGLIENEGFEETVAKLMGFVEESEIGLVVFGLPLHLSGEESESSKKVREFAEQFSKETGMEIGFCDERFTSIQSAQPLLMEKRKYRREKGSRDRGAAVLILQGYLDRHR